MKPIKYDNASTFFACAFQEIMSHGATVDGTKAIYGASFSIVNPLDNIITSRKWSHEYAKLEWIWYLSENPSIEWIKEKAKLWQIMADENGFVNSNYGYQWARTRQLNRVLKQLYDRPNTRRASISIYDGKETHLYEKDTPCTYALGFNILHGKLLMYISMRSCDLVYGFCNDQYCFSMLHQLVANALGLKVGTATWSIQSLHIYERHWNLKII